jgi:hypothetical protein
LVTATTVALLELYLDKAFTLTVVNGKEFADHSECQIEEERLVGDYI